MSDIKPANILAAVARANGITVEAIIGRSRVGTIAAPRLVAFYLLRAKTSLSYPAIGQLVERHHTTVLAACQSISDQLERWPDGKTAKAVGRALEALELCGNSDAAVVLPCPMAEDSFAEIAVAATMSPEREVERLQVQLAATQAELRTALRVLDDVAPRPWEANLDEPHDEQDNGEFDDGEWVITDASEREIDRGSAGARWADGVTNGGWAREYVADVNALGATVESPAEQVR